MDKESFSTASNCASQKLISRLAAFVSTIVLLIIAGCGGGSSGDGGDAAASGPRILVENNCSGASLRNKHYFLTIRNTDSSDVLVNNAKLENLPRDVRFEEIIVAGDPFLGIAIPIPSGVPRNQELQFTVLGSDGELLPTCLAQLTHLVTSDAGSVFVTALHEISPKVGLREDGAADAFDEVCTKPLSLILDVQTDAARQLHGSICYSGTIDGQNLAFKYNVADGNFAWQSNNSNVIAVSNSGLVRALGVGSGPVTASLSNATGSTAVSTTGRTGPCVPPNCQSNPIVSMSNVAVQEGNDGVKAVALTVQLSTQDGAPLSEPVTIDYVTSRTSAAPGSDYCSNRECSNNAELVGSVVIPAGSFSSTPIRVSINGDPTPEPDETFTLTLMPRTGVANPPSAEITLQNDDGPLSQVFAKGVGLWKLTGGEMTLRAPAAGDKAYLVWNQKTSVLGDVRIKNETLRTSFAVTENLLVGKRAFVDAGIAGVACFVAELPVAALATTTSDNVGRYSISNTDSFDGAGIIVVSGLIGKTTAPSLTKGLHTFATFTDGGSDVAGHFVELKAGCDFLFHGTKGNENSEVVTFAFAPAQQDRYAKVTFFAADARSVSDPGRGSEVLALVGDDQGTLPTRLDDKNLCSRATGVLNCVTVLGSDLTPFRPALVGNNGDGWDTFGQNSGTGSSATSPLYGSAAFRDPDLRGLIVIPAGATFVSVQVISPAERRGDSLALPLMALEMFPSQ